VQWGLEPSRCGCGLSIQRLGITEVSVIVSAVGSLIHPWKDLALGNFIMQMTTSAPVPATVLKRTWAAVGVRLAGHVWAGRVDHTLVESMPPLQ